MVSRETEFVICSVVVWCSALSEINDFEQGVITCIYFVLTIAPRASLSCPQRRVITQSGSLQAWPLLHCDMQTICLTNYYWRSCCILITAGGRCARGKQRWPASLQLIGMLVSWVISSLRLTRLRQWYDVAIRPLYESPYLSGRAYELFVRTICPSVLAHIKVKTRIQLQ